MALLCHLRCSFGCNGFCVMVDGRTGVEVVVCLLGTSDREWSES